jgi:hypothetical protein
MLVSKEIWLDFLILRVSLTAVNFKFITQGYLGVPENERPSLLLQKFDQCCVVFDFRDAESDREGKEIKRLALIELVEYVSTTRGIITEDVYPAVFKMVTR